MSKLIPESEYKKTIGGKFCVWLAGEKDPYIDTVEMKIQEEYVLNKQDELKNIQDKMELEEKVYNLEKNREIRWLSKFYKITSLVFCALLLVVLLITVSYLPRVGNENNPNNNELSKRYVEKSLEETGAVNTVAGMILQYRGFDTFAETHVLFVATICVMILLMVDDEKMRGVLEVDDRKYEPKNDAILQKAAFILVPVVVMFGFYVMVNGHLSPGGGFSGGAIVGAGMILYVSAFGFEKTQKFFDEKIYKMVKVGALLCYAGIMSYYFFTGGNGLESVISLGTPGNIFSAGLMLPINILVGLEVACTMYAFYALFRRGGL